MMEANNESISKLGRNTIIASAVFSILIWFVVGDVNQTISFTHTLLMCFLLGGVSITISTLIKLHNVRWVGKVYGTFTSVLCVILFFMWINTPGRLTISLTFLAVGFILVSYIEIVFSLSKDNF